MRSGVTLLRASRLCWLGGVAAIALAVTNTPRGVAQSPDTQSGKPDAPLDVRSPAENAGSDRILPENKDALGGLTAGWDEGFYIRSADKKFNLRITGQIQSDYHGYLNGADQTDISTFLVRRARLGIEANVANIYEFRMLPDFAQGQSRIFDAYLNVHLRDAFQVEIGKFKQPFSYEQLIQDRFVPTMERSLLDTLVPARDVGLMLHGQKLFEDRFDYGVSISNGQQNGDLDLSNGIDLNARIAFRPFRQVDVWPALRTLQLGVAGSVGSEFEPVNASVFRTPATIPWFRYAPGVLADGLRTRWCPEVVFFTHGLGFAAQYLHQQQVLRSAPAAAPAINIPFDSYYVLVSWLLTGEERTTYSKAIEPLRPFDPATPLNAPGAWEAMFRISRLRVGDEAFAAGIGQLADPTRSSPGATELTLGMNWYFNKWVRAQFNWEHAWFDRPVPLGAGPGGLLSIQNTLMARLQVIF